jgi:hypothetical protein
MRLSYDEGRNGTAIGHGWGENYVLHLFILPEAFA